MFKTRKKFDQTFKREAVKNWLASGKSARVVVMPFLMVRFLIYGVPDAS